MKRVYLMMGKSSSGKDSIYREVLRNNHIGLKPVISYTTRPIRENEKNGKQYFFVSEAERDRLMAEGKVLEIRNYNTAMGLWSYFTVDDEYWEEDSPHIMIGTLDTYESLKKNCTDCEIIPIYIEVEDGERLFRALRREQKEKKPKYVEMCRRFIADTNDFSEERLRELKIENRFDNAVFKETVKNVLDFIEA
ncbi:MAG: guanylate kinase [Lachnospiraceae bacterium]|nr:guanylate kinase [Lachnospiraceae bacterium]